MNEKGYQVVMSSHSMARLKGFRKVEEAVIYAKSQKDVYNVVRVEGTGTGEVIITFQDGNLMEET